MSGRGRFFSATRYARDALGLASARRNRSHVHVADWYVTAGAGRGLRCTGSCRRRMGIISCSWTCVPIGPPVLNGDAGLSRKADAPGAASYYYSMPRLQAPRAAFAARARALPVSGLAWLDREWGSGSLGPNQQGWDWFALDLSDGSALMFYALRDQRRTPRCAQCRHLHRCRGPRHGAGQ